MGKRKRRINNPKFAIKFAKTRETFNRLKEAAKLARNNITDTAEQVVDNVVESVEEIVEDIKQVFEEPKENPNALKFLKEKENNEVEVVEKPKPKTSRRKPKTTKKPATTTKKTTTTTRRRRSTKTKS